MRLVLRGDGSPRPKSQSQGGVANRCRSACTIRHTRDLSDASEYGGAGNDLLDGGGDRDRLYGEAGVDRLQGGGDPDALDGGADTPDRCDGEGGDDTATPSCETTISATTRALL